MSSTTAMTQQNKTMNFLIHDANGESTEHVSPELLWAFKGGFSMWRKGGGRCRV